MSIEGETMRFQASANHQVASRQTNANDASLRLMQLVGKGIAHSLSPALYETVFRELGLPWRYCCMDAPDKTAARRALLLPDCLASNVTTPYKALALELADTCDISAVFARGANLLVRFDGETRAFNTDGWGFAFDFVHRGLIFEGKRIVVCGTGPTARSIACAAALRAAASVTLLSRSERRALETKRDFRTLAERVDSSAQEGDSFAPRLRFESYEKGRFALETADVVVDATPLGLHAGDPAPFDCAILHPWQVACDVVYGKGVTAFARGAQQAGCRFFDGRGMLAGQAVRAFRLVCQAAERACPLSDEDLFSLFKSVMENVSLHPSL